MGIGNQLLFFFAGLGVFNGLLLAIYFLFILKPKKWVNLLFGFLMLMLCIRIGKSLFVVFTEVSKFYRQIGLSACIMIGPFLYLYLKTFLTSNNKIQKQDWAILLLPFFSISILGLLWPYAGFPNFWNTRVVYFIYAVWIVFMMTSLRFIWPAIRTVWKQKGTVSEYWILLLYSSIFLLCLAFNLALFGFPYLAGPLLFSIVLYVLIGFFLSKKNRSVIIQTAPNKYQKQKLDPEQIQSLLERLSTLMENQQVYLNPKIKLAGVAQSIDSTPHEVSRLINDHLGISFNQYINEFRVKAACQLLKEADHFTVEGIGREVGFTSRTAFYTAFKLLVGQTPGQFKSQQQ